MDHRKIGDIDGYDINNAINIHDIDHNELESTCTLHVHFPLNFGK